MDNRKHDLMKYFSLVLKRRVKAEESSVTISESLLKYLSRKELIEIIQYKDSDNMPKSQDLMEMENEELLKLIEDELFVLAYMSSLWCKELSDESAKKEKKQESKEDAQKSSSAIASSGKHASVLPNKKKSLK